MSYHVPGIMLDAQDTKVNKTNVILILVKFAAIKCVSVGRGYICNNVKRYLEGEKSHTTRK